MIETWNGIRQDLHFVLSGCTKFQRLEYPMYVGGRVSLAYTYGTPVPPAAGRYVPHTQEEQIFEFRQAKRAGPVATRKIQKQRKSSSKTVAINNNNNNNDNDKKYKINKTKIKTKQ